MRSLRELKIFYKKRYKFASKSEVSKDLPHLLPPSLVVLKNQIENQYFIRQYLSHTNYREVSYHFVPKSLHTVLLCRQFGKC